MCFIFKLINNKKRRIQYGMSAFFLRKIFIKISGILIASFFVFSCVFYGYFLSRSKLVDYQTTYYLLVCGGTNIEVGAEFVKLEGGAAYLWEDKYVVASIYKKEEDAESVRLALKQRGKEYTIQTVCVENLYFKGEKKKKQDMYLSALNSFRGCLDVIMGCASNLDAGQPQERIKRILTSTHSQLKYLSSQYTEEYLSFSRVCENIARDLQGVEGEVVYSSDLRYISCAMADGYLQLCKQFAL